MEPTIHCVVWNSVHLPKDMQLYRRDDRGRNGEALIKKQKPFWMKTGGLMRTLTKAALTAAGALMLAATGASAAIVCNDDGDCWHVHGRPTYGSDVKVHIYPDNWKWRHSDHYRWREHAGRGYWRHGVWVDIR